VTPADYARCEALLESIHAIVHPVAEGQAALIERCDRIETRLARIDDKLEQIGIQLTAIDSKLTAINSKLTVINSKLTAIDSKLTAFDTKLDTFSINTHSRLKRIETHLRLNGPPVQGNVHRAAPRSGARRRDRGVLLRSDVI